MPAALFEFAVCLIVVAATAASTNPACSPDAPVTLPRFHIPQPVHSAGDVNAVFEYKGVKHLFHQDYAGWAHHTSADWIRWEQQPSILGPGNCTPRPVNMLIGWG